MDGKPVHMERVHTGIEGLDDLIEGGFPRGSVTLVTGGAGTGKTIFCSQFLWKGVQQGEKCLYLSTEEMPNEIKQDIEVFGWDFESEPELLDMEYFLATENVRNEIEEFVVDGDYDRIVLDSISVLAMYWSDEASIRRDTSNMLKLFRDLDATVLVTAELPEESGRLSRYGIAEFIADGVIKLGAKSMGSGLERTLDLTKMRATNIDGGIKNLEISGNGLRVSS